VSPTRAIAEAVHQLWPYIELVRDEVRLSGKADRTGFATDPARATDSRPDDEPADIDG
jgi:hypothetical protein